MSDMAFIQEADARRHQERVNRARGVYGQAASERLATDREWGPFYAPRRQEEE